MHSAYRASFSARQVLTILGVQTDPNNQACFLMFGISISLYYIITRKQMIVPGIATIVINMFSMMMTASRGGIVAVVAMLIIILLFVVKDTKTKIWGIIGVAAVAFIVFRYSNIYVSVASIERLVDLEDYEGGGHRIEIWKNALQLVNENPLYYLFGAGWGSYYTYNGWLGMHNTYLETFCNTGLIGLFLFYYPILKSSIYLWKKERYLPIFIILPILIAAFFLDSINKRYFWNSILVLFLFYFNERDKDYSSIQSESMN